MNQFLAASIRAVNRHGKMMTYKSISRVVDKITGKVITSTVAHSVKMYPKSVVVNQYNYPDLIGKSVVIFYLVNQDLGFTPVVNDTITIDGRVFTVRSYDFHEALGMNCLYRITGASS